MWQCKIIAIRVEKDCNPRLKKIINPNVFYYFYNNYLINDNSIQENAPQIPTTFFKSGDCDVNISAIVGKNGTGKSSLIELLIAGINNLSHHLELNDDIEWIDNLNMELYFVVDAYYKIKFHNENLVIYRQGFDKASFVVLEKNDFDLKYLFYSIVVNYSHYGLNSLEIGTWIDSLYHKNDGYQTPIVINPQRTDGNIDVNLENSLSKDRLISNVIVLSNKETKSVNVTENLIAYELMLKLKVGDNPILYTNKKSSLPQIDDSGFGEEILTGNVRFLDLPSEGHNEILKRINHYYDFNYSGEVETRNYIIELTHNYIIKKLVKIAVIYPFYNRYFDKETGMFNMLDDFLVQLLDINENHISYKLKQALNFLKYRYILVENSNPIRISIREMAERLRSIFIEHNIDIDRAIEFIPPPIFSTELILHTVDSDTEVEFSSLSSGERQHIYSINSIFYHLANIDSIKVTKLQNGYSNVNIILDEIELYFHPDLQRHFISSFLERMTKTKFQRIKSINICFVTHSPFILSDIPDGNILFLDESGAPIKTNNNIKTFGANIHDLLKDSFFLKTSAMGVFAQKVINETITFLKIRRIEKELSILKRSESTNGIDRLNKNIRQIEIIKLKSQIKNFDIEYHKTIIGMVAEPILRMKLIQMLDEIDENELALVQRQIKELQVREEKLKNRN